MYENKSETRSRTEGIAASNMSIRKVTFTESAVGGQVICNRGRGDRGSQKTNVMGVCKSGITDEFMLTSDRAFGATVSGTIGSTLDAVNVEGVVTLA